jgi:hypothetical protein
VYISSFALFILKALGEYFPPGTTLYKTTNSTPESIETLASTHTIMLINKSGAEAVVSLNGHRVTLYPYQVSILAYR